MTRAERFSALIKEDVSDILKREVSDPRIDFVSITDVTLSPDLKDAKIFVSIFGDQEKKEQAMQGLSSATGFIRSKLAQLLETRSAPVIHFVRDDSIERGSRVLSLLSQLNKSDDKKRITKNKKSLKKR